MSQLLRDFSPGKRKEILFKVKSLIEDGYSLDSIIIELSLPKSIVIEFYKAAIHD